MNFFEAMNNIDTYKVGLLNSIAILISFANIEDFLKIILLIVSIIYTIYKILELMQKRKEKKSKKLKDENRKKD